jgi:hypothetical protein
MLRIRLIALAVTIAFAFQSYVTQTHIHIPQPGAGFAKLLGNASSVGKIDSEDRGKDPFPAQDDPAKCPLCQEIAHSGAYISPVAAASILPAESVSVVALVKIATVLIRTTSFIWQTRAPPRV